MGGIFRDKECEPWLLPPLPGETAEELEQRRNQAYFDQQHGGDCAEWFQRMAFDIPLAGLRVLDLGCGHGALSIRFAEEGAAQVMGLDLDDERVDFAQRNLASAFPQFRDQVEFLCQDVCELQLDNYFDLIVSKDSFEHIDDLPGVVGHLHRLLKPGGLLAPGFSPLYYSPFGDHGRFETGIPWLHAFLPEGMLLQRINTRTGSQAESSMDLGLNRLTPAEFRGIFARSADWSELTIKYNRGGRRLMPLFNGLRQLPFLEKYFTVNIYATARKSA